MLRQLNMRQGSSFSELYLRTERMTGNSADGRIFPFVNCTRLQLFEVGLSSTPFAGTSAKAVANVRDNGLTNAANLDQRIGPTGNFLLDETDLLTNPGFTVKRAGGMIDPATREETPLADLLFGDDEGTREGMPWGGHNIAMQLFMNPISVSSFDGYCWAKVRVWYPVDN